jgi:DNA polymerase (family X)
MHQASKLYARYIEVSSVAHGHRGTRPTIHRVPRRVARTDPPPEDAAPVADTAAPGAAAKEAIDPGDPNVLPHADRDDEPDDADDGDPASAPDPTSLTNGRLARVFHEIGDILELKGEIKFKTVAYHRAADAIARAPFDVAAAYRATTEASEKPPPISGVGSAISDKLVELSTTGRLAYHERLRAEIPPSLVGLLRIPGLGPKTVKLIYEQLGVETLDDLRQAADAHTLQGLKGVSASTEARILDGIRRLESQPRRLLISRAQTLADDLVAYLRSYDGVREVHIAGSLRRRKETIGDLDLLVETDQPDEVIERFVSHGSVDKIVGRGHAKAAVTLIRGPNVDLMVMPPGQAGSYLVHFTGSAAHNTHLRGLARDRGWSLSEKGYVRLSPEGEPMAGPEADLRTFETEQDVYGFLDLPLIVPELREDHGEIEAALAGRLPKLVTRADLRGDLHTHSDWSDGVHTIEVMAEAARRKGYRYQVLTDHSQSLAIARGLDPDRVEQEREVIARLNERFEAERAAGTLPQGADPEGFRLLHGCELEIRADGDLDFPDELLATFDLVVASVHVSRRQPRDDLTRRTLNGIHSPHVDVIAHPAGRMIQTRDDLDLDWDLVYREAARTGTVLEMNGSPHRLDLAFERARRAVEFGCLLSIDSDAHSTAELEYVRWGTEQARRAWVEPQHVLNTRSLEDLLAWVAAKPTRV